MEIEQRGPFVISAVVCQETRDHENGFDILGVLTSAFLKFTEPFSAKFIAAVIGGPKAVTKMIRIAMTLPQTNPVDISGRAQVRWHGSGTGCPSPIDSPPKRRRDDLVRRLS